jgi:hypothetical protein
MELTQAMLGNRGTADIAFLVFIFVLLLVWTVAQLPGGVTVNQHLNS